MSRTRSSGLSKCMGVNNFQHAGSSKVPFQHASWSMLVPGACGFLKSLESRGVDDIGIAGHLPSSIPDPTRGSWRSTRQGSATCTVGVDDDDVWLRRDVAPETASSLWRRAKASQYHHKATDLPHAWDSRSPSLIGQLHILNPARAGGWEAEPGFFGRRAAGRSYLSLPAKAHVGEGAHHDNEGSERAEDRHVHLLPWRAGFEVQGFGGSEFRV